MSAQNARRARRLVAGAIAVFAALPASASLAAVPDTTVSGPWVVPTTTATYRFSSADATARFECSLNLAAWSACASPATVTPRVGSNQFQVRAVNASGRDATPARQWTQVDTVAPVVTISSPAPDAEVTGAVTVSAAGSDDYSMGSLSASVDGAAVPGLNVVTTSSRAKTLDWTLNTVGLAPGAHVIAVRGTDSAGNAREATVKVRVAERAGTGAADPAASSRLFAASSFWNAPLSPSAPLDPQSPAIAAAFRAEVSRQIAANIGPWISSTSYSTPIYRVGADAARVPVILDTGTWGDTLRRQLASGVPIPAGAVQASGTDGHLTIWQPSTDTLWEFWHAVRKADGWHAGWGGVMHDVSQSPGHFRDRRDGTGQLVEQANWGATATSLPVAGGTVTAAEASSGRIDHALALNVPNPCEATHSWPAQRGDGTSTAADCMPEGARLRLDPSLDLSTLAMPRFTRMLAEAAQRHGIVVRDRTGVATGFFVEDPEQFGSDVWAGTTGTDGLLGAKPWNLVRNQFPWGRLQVVKMELTEN
jgi:hypothetical protein